MKSRSIEHVDVLIVGAGISGIGAASYLQKMQPTKTFAIVEARARHRRNVGPVPVSGNSFGLRSAHVQLRIQGMGERKKAIASADAHHVLPAGDRRRERHW